MEIDKGNNQALAKMENIRKEFADLKEKFFLAKLKIIKQEQEAISNGTHEKLLTRTEDLDEKKKERILSAQLWRDYQLQNINNQFEAEKRQAEEEFLVEKQQLKERMLLLIGERHKKVEEEKALLTLTDNEPRGLVSSRALRHRRGKEPPIASVPHSVITGRKKTPQISFTLKEYEINEDYAIIFKPLNQTFLKDYLKVTSGLKPQPKDEVYQENGVLHLRNMIFEKGNTVIVEKEGVVVAVGAIATINLSEIQVRNNTGLKTRIPLTQLRNGRVTLKQITST